MQRLLRGRSDAEFLFCVCVGLADENDKNIFKKYQNLRGLGPRKSGRMFKKTCVGLAHAKADACLKKNLRGPMADACDEEKKTFYFAF